MNKNAVLAVALVLLGLVFASWSFSSSLASKGCEIKTAEIEGTKAAQILRLTTEKDSCMLRLDECRTSLVESTQTTAQTTILTTSIPLATTSIKSKGYGTPIPLKPVQSNQSETKNLLCFANKTLYIRENAITQTVEVDCETGEPVY